MAVCTKCGTESEGQFCTNCGASLTAPEENTAAPAQNVSAPPQNIPGPVQNYQNPAPNYHNAPPPYPNPAPNYQIPPPVYNNVSVVQPNKVTSPGGWIGWMLLMSVLPLIAQIIMICVSDDESVKNFAKAQFYIILIIMVLVIIGFVFLFALGMIGAASM